jgi:tetratricopeptide (TPR) repeat protein
MPRHFSSAISLLLVPLVLIPCVAATAGGTWNEVSISNAASSYDSDNNRANSAMHGAVAGSPEDDGRPGEFYFKLGASAFQHKDYAHAVEMYKVAASWADKNAEANLAVMYARGQGVPVDLPLAMAWSALAAERGDAHFVETREVIYSYLNKEQFDQSNVIWRELKKTYGDDIALVRAKGRWNEVRANMTGSHVGSAVDLQVSNGANTPPHSADGYVNYPAVGTHRSTTNTFQLTGGNQEDSSISYQQFRESKNPYDPKFERSSMGTVLVSPLQPVKDDKETPASDPKPPEGGKID